MADVLAGVPWKLESGDTKLCDAECRLSARLHNIAQGIKAQSTTHISSLKVKNRAIDACAYPSPRTLIVT